MKTFSARGNTCNGPMSCCIFFNKTVFFFSKICEIFTPHTVYAVCSTVGDVQYTSAYHEYSIGGGAGGAGGAFAPPTFSKNLSLNNRFSVKTMFTRRACKNMCENTELRS